MLTVWYETPEGVKVRPLQGVIELSYALVDGDVGVLQLVTAADLERLKDYRVTVYRRGVREISAFLNSFKTATTSRGSTLNQIGGFGPNSFLQNRIVNDYAASTGAKKTGTVGSIMRDVVSEQMIADADSARNISQLNALPSSFGPSVSASFAWDNVLDLLQDLQSASKTQGDEVFFQVKQTGDNAFSFVTYTGQPGNDRTVYNPLVFGLKYGNLERPSLVENYEDEKNAIYAGGPGEGQARIVQEAEDPVAQNHGPVSRRERFFQASRAVDAVAVQDKAEEALTRYRSTKYFSGTIIPSASSPYGGVNGWKMGDRVRIEYAGIVFNALVRAVMVSVSEGKEEVSARVEAVL